MNKDIRLKVKEIFEDTKKKHLQVQTRKNDRLNNEHLADAIFNRNSGRYR